MNAAGPGSEYSLPPSYRPRHHLGRIPSVMAGTGPGHTGDNSATNMMMSNANESACMPAITETRAIITSANHQHQLQQQQLLQQQLLLQQNSIISDATVTMSPVDTVTTARSATKSSATPQTTNAISAADDNVNTTKISHICSMQNNGALSMVAKAPMSDISRLLLDTEAADKVSVMASDATKGRKDLVTIVTISGCTNPIDATGEMDILAHL